MADFPTSEKQNALQKKILASYEKAEAKHKNVMAGITKSENSTFKRLNDALTASREVDAKNKDKLGNTMPPSEQTKYLQGQLMNHMANQSQKGRKLTPGGAGITPKQIEEGDFAGWGGINTPDAPIQPFGERGDYNGMPGTSDLLQRPPSQSLEPGDATTEVPLPRGRTLKMPQEKEIFPMDTPATTSRGDKITLKGPQREGQNGIEYLVVSADGREAWLPRAGFEVAEEGGKKPRGLTNLLRHYEGPVEDFQPF
jgi:hypothetical protein